jgi:tetratricopeptide (TPR) repeat protein
MLKHLHGLFLSVICITGATAQTMDPSAPDYNQPYDTLLAKGNKGYNAGKMLGVKSPALALIFYNRAIEINKDRWEAHKAKGQAYMEYRMLDEAIESYSTCLEVSPDNPECLYGIFYTSFLGSTNHNMNEVPQPMMKQIYNSAIAFLAVAPETMVQEKANASMLGYMFKLGIDNNDLFQKYMANNADEPTEANIQVLKEILPAVQATTNGPVVAGILSKLVESAFYKKDYVNVKAYANQALATGAAYSTTYYFLAHTLYYQDKNAAEAEKICDLGLKHGPYDATKNLKLDIIYSESKKAYAAKDYAKTITLLDKFVKINEYSERVRALLGFSNFALKKYPEALKHLKFLKENAMEPTAKIYYPNLDALIAFAAKPGPTPPVVQTPLLEVEKQEAIQTQGLDLYDEKKYTEALALLNQALPYFEQTKNVYKQSYILMQIGLNHHDLEDYEKAKDYYRKSIAVGGFAPNAYNYLGLLINAVDKNPADAQKVVEEGLAKFPDNKGLNSRLGRIFAGMGDTAFDAKDYPTAITHYEKAMTYYNDAEVFTFLGFSYYFIKDSEKCLEALDNAVYMNPNIAETYPAINQIFAALR